MNTNSRQTPPEDHLLPSPGKDGRPQSPGENGPCTEAFADGQKAHPHHGGVHAHADIPENLPKVSNWFVVLAGLILVGALVGLFFLGWIPREHRLARLQKDNQAVDDKPSVDIALPTRTASALDLVLPADVTANQETAILPRANGYLKRFTVDIGDHVKSGQLLAEIDAPDIDAELLQAKASVAQSQANLVKGKNDLDLAQSTLVRYEGFAKTGGVTQQQIDEKRAAFTQAQSDYAADQANLQASQAAVQRFESMQGFEKIYAPFDGNITARGFDVGALMSATNPTPMFRIADTSILRVYTNVPQSYVQSVKIGDHVAIAVRNYPGREFTGTVTRTAAALDPSTRTLRYEIDVPNKDGLLYAGMYGEVRIKSSQQSPPLIVPTSAVVFDSGGTKVWVLDQNKIHERKVVVGRDFGTEIEIPKGLDGDEKVVTNPGERLADGIEVDARVPKKEAAPKPQEAAAR